MGTPRGYKRDSLDLQAVFFPPKPLEPQPEVTDDHPEETNDCNDDESIETVSVNPQDCTKSDSRQSSLGSIFTEDIDATSRAHCSGSTWCDTGLLAESGIFSLEKSSRMMMMSHSMAKALEDSKLQSFATFPNWYDSVLDAGHQSTSTPENLGWRRSSQSVSRSSYSVSRSSLLSRSQDSKLASILAFAQMNDSAVSDLEASCNFHMQGPSSWRAPCHDPTNASLPSRRSSSQSSKSPSLSSLTRGDYESMDPNGPWPSNGPRIGSILAFSQWNDSDISSLEASRYFHLQGPSSWGGAPSVEDPHNAALPSRRSSSIYRPSNNPHFVRAETIPEHSSFNNSSSEATDANGPRRRPPPSASESPRCPSRRKSIDSKGEAPESEESNHTDQDNPVDRYFL